MSLFDNLDENLLPKKRKGRPFRRPRPKRKTVTMDDSTRKIVTIDGIVFVDSARPLRLPKN